MRSKDIAAQYERAFNLLEKQLEAAQAALLQEQQSRLSERQWFLEQFSTLQNLLANTSARTNTIVLDSHTKLAEMIDRSHDLNAIPQGDTPTMEEMIELAKSDPETRKRIESTLRELEFEDPLVGFN